MLRTWSAKLGKKDKDSLIKHSWLLPLGPNSRTQIDASMYN